MRDSQLPRSARRCAGRGWIRQFRLADPHVWYALLWLFLGGVAFVTMVGIPGGARGVDRDGAVGACTASRALDDAFLRRSRCPPGGRGLGEQSPRLRKPQVQLAAKPGVRGGVGICAAVTLRRAQFEGLGAFWGLRNSRSMPRGCAPSGSCRTPTRRARRCPVELCLSLSKANTAFSAAQVVLQEIAP